MQIKKIRDIIPLIKKGYSDTQIGKMIEPPKARNTISLWKKKLHEAGYKFESKRGRPKLKI